MSEEIPDPPVPVVDSILGSIKKVLGIEYFDTAFDPDIIMHINSTFMTLNQIGIGPVECYSIEDDTATWADFLADATKLGGLKTYIFLKVRRIFDPPATEVATAAMDRVIAEAEWRLNVQVEAGTYALLQVEEDLEDGY